jgi:hypothetical protein
VKGTRGITAARQSNFAAQCSLPPFLVWALRDGWPDSEVTAPTLQQTTGSPACDGWTNVDPCQWLAWTSGCVVNGRFLEPACSMHLIAAAAQSKTLQAPRFPAPDGSTSRYLAQLPELIPMASKSVCLTMETCFRVAEARGIRERLLTDAILALKGQSWTECQLCSNGHLIVGKPNMK